MSFRAWFWVLFVGVMGMASTLSAQIYADVTLAGGVTGTFRIQLEHTKAPVAVANFIGLATGQNGWIDPVTGRLRNDPFYNGLTFHRVIAGFVSQTGSRNGLGNDGPGYTFGNEIDASLSHATPYTVAMANSGGRYSNGSQFYITTPTSAVFLDGNYTIFGRVISGTSVCDALNAVATNTTTAKPLVDVTISSIVLSGDSLATFNLKPNPLPRVVGGKPVMKINGAAYALDYARLPYSSYFGSRSADLVSWSRFVNETYFHSSAPGAGDIDVTTLATGGRHFFQLPRVDYSLCYNPLRPTSVANRTFSFPGLFGSQQLQIAFNGAGTGGTYSLSFTGESPLNGTLGQVTYTRENNPYGPYLYVFLNRTVGLGFDIEIAFDRLEYSAATSGNFVARTNVNNFLSTSGNFTSTP
jgi:peptidyl-prolyl cis-trans isomerase A (cyclophilin A)